MFCKHCGAQLKDTAKFCGKCGAKIAAVQEQIPVSQPGSVYTQPQRNVAVSPKPTGFLSEFCATPALHIVGYLYPLLILFEVIINKFAYRYLGNTYYQILDIMFYIIPFTFLGVLAYIAARRSFKFSIIYLIPYFAANVGCNAILYLGSTISDISDLIQPIVQCLIWVALPFAVIGIVKLILCIIPSLKAGMTICFISAGVSAVVYLLMQLSNRLFLHFWCVEHMEYEYYSISWMFNYEYFKKIAIIFGINVVGCILINFYDLIFKPKQQY